MAVMGFLVAPLVIGVIFLLVWQLGLVFNNATTIESYEYEAEQYVARREGKVRWHCRCIPADMCPAGHVPVSVRQWMACEYDCDVWPSTVAVAASCPC